MASARTMQPPMAAPTGPATQKPMTMAATTTITAPACPTRGRSRTHSFVLEVRAESACRATCRASRSTIGTVSRRGDPVRIFAAQRSAVTRRPEMAGVPRDLAERWVAAWLATADRAPTERDHEFWDRAVSGVMAERAEVGGARRALSRVGW